MSLDQFLPPAAISTIEGLQRTMEVSRNEAADHFLSRLRKQLASLLEGAQVSLENLKASENKLRDESQAIRERFKNFLQRTTQISMAEVQEKTLGMLDQFDSDVTRRLVECHDELNEMAVKIIADTSRILSELPQSCEESVQGQLRLLVSSAAVEVTRVLKENRPDCSLILEPARS
jgi:DNA repair exonuclease SbcCD ATPase subunit